ncbi:hypothetical protein [Aminipila terrae]|uniref:IrrE N-terminal-like domain-containing protein n=1 Tax=Aminipila terrae TaxID=2697030 RepID=A0A6P1MI74_9FIRM|nr:hypothetical protein [Aminipila terrae]QHI72893.1 hypothetical protein Ami3637_11180 [Aminipila terrae]
MNIPEIVRIGGVKYEVRYEEGLNNGTSLAYGHIDYDKTMIRLAPGLQSKQGECKTLLHEILHGVSKHFDLEIENDENTIDALARGLYMVIVDNPEMFGVVPQL